VLALTSALLAHLSPGHRVEGGSLAEIFRCRRATKCDRLYAYPRGSLGSLGNHRVSIRARWHRAVDDQPRSAVSGRRFRAQTNGSPSGYRVPNRTSWRARLQSFLVKVAAAARLTAAAWVSHGIAYVTLRRHAARTRPSSTAALINTSKSVTPSAAVLTIRCAISVAGVRCDRSIRSTAVCSAEFMRATNSGMKVVGGTLVTGSSSEVPCSGSL
jgi:hypothetical protein